VELEHRQLVIPLSYQDQDATSVATWYLETVKTLLVSTKETTPLVLVVLEVTGDSGGTGNGASEDGPSIRGAVFGLIRTARIELPSWFRIVCMMSNARGSELATQVHAEMRMALEVPQSQATIEVKYEDGERSCPQLLPSKEHLIGEVCLDLAERGKLSHLKLKQQTVEGEEALDGEPAMVGVQVHAVGLNFKDLLNVMMPDGSGFIGEVPLPGTDFAGVVTAVPRGGDDDSGGGGGGGDGGGNFKVGDRVFGLCLQKQGMLRSKAMVRTDTLAKMPKGWSMEDASVLPTVTIPHHMDTAYMHIL